MPSFFLDKKSPIEKNYNGDLPHWFQPEKIQYVTFRLSDSLPTTKIEELNQIRDRFLEKYPQPWDQNVLHQYNMAMGNCQQELLDNGYGKCYLENSEYRDIVVQSLHFGDNRSYKLIAYVIMPNHVHLLLQPYGEERIEKIIGSIKRFTATVINKQLAKSGAFWQREIWARIVRNSSGLTRYIEYIKQNPKGLKEGKYTLYISKEFG